MVNHQCLDTLKLYNKKICLRDLYDKKIKNFQLLQKHLAKSNFHKVEEEKYVLSKYSSLI